MSYSILATVTKPLEPNLKSKAWGRKLEVASKMVCRKERKARRIPDQVLQLLLLDKDK